MRRPERISPSFVSSASKSSPLFPFRKVTCTLVSNRPFLTHLMHLSGLGDRLMEDTQGAPPRGCTFSFSWQGMVSRAPSLMIDYQPLSTTVSSALWIKKNKKTMYIYITLLFIPIPCYWQESVFTPEVFNIFTWTGHKSARQVLLFWCFSIAMCEQEWILIFGINTEYRSYFTLCTLVG